MNSAWFSGHTSEKTLPTTSSMGTNARSGLMGLLLGNTAEKILDNLEAPVLVFKPEGRS